MPLRGTKSSKREQIQELITFNGSTYFSVRCFRGADRLPVGSCKGVQATMVGCQ